ncbi:hypothetical protein ACWF9G_15560 [Nocardia sp. NPDC055029]
MVVAEGVGDDGCGQFEDMLVQRADPACDAGNAEGSDQCPEGFGVHRLTGAALGTTNGIRDWWRYSGSGRTRRILGGYESA